MITIDRDPAWLGIARSHWARPPCEARIDMRFGEAIEVLETLKQDPEARFDIAFIDLDKARVGQYVEMTLRLLNPRGLIMVDNVMWHGWVLDSAHDDPDTSGMRRFNARVASDPGLDVVLLPIGDGVSLIRRAQ